MAAAFKIVYALDERRRYARNAVDRSSTLRTQDGQPIDVEVVELSRDGCLLRSATPLELNTPLTVGLAGGGRINGRLVRRARDLYGCAFDTILTDDQAATAFGPQPIVTALPGEPYVVPDAANIETKWSRRVRLLALIGATGSLWAGIAIAVRALSS